MFGSCNHHPEVHGDSWGVILPRVVSSAKAAVISLGPDHDELSFFRTDAEPVDIKAFAASGVGVLQCTAEQGERTTLVCPFQPEEEKITMHGGGG